MDELEELWEQALTAGSLPYRRVDYEWATNPRDSRIQLNHHVGFRYKMEIYINELFAEQKWQWSRSGSGRMLFYRNNLPTNQSQRESLKFMLTLALERTPSQPYISRFELNT